MPIRRAKLKAAERELNVTFLVMDAMTLKDWTERFDNVIDSGLFHVFSDEDRKRYAEGLATVLKTGGRLYLMCWSLELRVHVGYQKRNCTPPSLKDGTSNPLSQPGSRLGPI